MVMSHLRKPNEDSH